MLWSCSSTAVEQLLKSIFEAVTGRHKNTDRHLGRRKVGGNVRAAANGVARPGKTR